jgi:hypothetical protein
MNAAKERSIRIYISNLYISGLTYQYMNTATYDTNRIIRIDNRDYKIQRDSAISGYYIEFINKDAVVQNCIGNYSEEKIVIDPVTNIGSYSKTFVVTTNPQFGGTECPPTLVTRPIPQNECCKLISKYDSANHKIVTTNTLVNSQKCGSGYQCDSKLNVNRDPTTNDCGMIKTKKGKLKLTECVRQNVGSPKIYQTYNMISDSVAGNDLCKNVVITDKFKTETNCGR